MDAEHIAVDRVEGVGDVREQDGAALLKERLKGKGQYLVRTVAHEHLALLDAVGLGQRGHQLAGVRVGVELEPLVHPLLHRFHHLGGGRVGVLVGV